MPMPEQDVRQKSDVTRVRWIRLLRMISTLLPLKHRLSPLVKGYSRISGLLSVPWGDYQLVFPTSWHTSFAMTNFIFDGRRINPEFSLLKKLFAATRSGALIDIGAHIGCYVLEFRRYSNAPIIAYEPSPFVFELLNRNVAINRLEAVEVRRCACGDVNGVISLNAGINSSISPTCSLQISGCASPRCNGERLAVTARQEMPEQVTVRLVALDDELESLERVSFLKVDCEGFEYHVLSGAKRILDKHRPIVLIELHPQLIGQYGHTPEDVCNLLRPLYELEFYDFDLARKHNRYVRFLNRYLPNRGHRFSSEASMLNAASSEPVPTQLYIVGYPKGKNQSAQEVN